MRKNTLLAILAACACVFLAILFDHDSIMVLLNFSALILVLGGTACLAVALGTFEDAKALPKVVKKALLGTPEDPTETIGRIIEMAEVSRKEGLLHLEEFAGEDPDPFLRRGLELVVDGKDAETIRDVLDGELDALGSRHAQGARTLKQAGGFAPTLGIIGTVIGLVHVMTNLSSPQTLGPAIGAAFTTTLWGVLSANIIWHPMAAKLVRLSEIEVRTKEAIVDGLLAIHAGESPRTVETLLTSYLPARPARRSPRTTTEDAQAADDGAAA
ncbi:MAG: motility protein A [Acidimicrobiales bacterium]